MSDLSQQTAQDVLQRYQRGEREFFDLELDDADFSGANLECILFQRCWLMACFQQAHLKNAVFRECNVKSADFSGADLRNASFVGSVVCAIILDGADLEGASFIGAIIIARK